MRLDLLERWKAKYGKQARDWFNSLGQTEAIAALAKLAGDEPDWQFPTVYAATGDQDVVVGGDQVGHPLLDEGRVRNDVQMGPVGTVSVGDWFQYVRQKYVAAERGCECRAGSDGHRCLCHQVQVPAGSY